MVRRELATCSPESTSHFSQVIAQAKYNLESPLQFIITQFPVVTQHSCVPHVLLNVFRTSTSDRLIG